MGQQREQLAAQVTEALYDVERTVYLALDRETPPSKDEVMDYLDTIAVRFGDILGRFDVEPLTVTTTSYVDLASEIDNTYDEYVPDPWGVWSE